MIVLLPSLKWLRRKKSIQQIIMHKKKQMNLVNYKNINIIYIIVILIQNKKLIFFIATKSLAEEQPKVKELVELITDCVKSDKRSSININVLHQTSLIGTKSKKQISNKKPNKKKKTITRKKYADLGLYTLSRNSLKYIDLVPLHKLWKNYILEHLSLPSDTLQIPDVDTLCYDAYSKRLIKSDFHGAKITVSRSKCSSLVGIHGIIAMDTKNTFKVLSKDNQLRSKFYLYQILFNIYRKISIYSYSKRGFSIFYTY